MDWSLIYQQEAQECIELTLLHKGFHICESIMRWMGNLKDDHGLAHLLFLQGYKWIWLRLSYKDTQVPNTLWHILECWFFRSCSRATHMVSQLGRAHNKIVTMGRTPTIDQFNKQEKQADPKDRHQKERIPKSNDSGVIRTRASYDNRTWVCRSATEPYLNGNIGWETRTGNYD